jgi:hypothetical protein
MGGDSEWGICDCCGNDGPIVRTYYRYDVKCECCNNKHFEIVYHCIKCEPTDPGIRKIQLSNEQKHKIENI